MFGKVSVKILKVIIGDTMKDTLMLTTEEFAFFEGIRPKSIKKRIERGLLNVIKISVNTRYGFEYRISPNELSPKGQKRYYANLKAKASEQLTLDSYPFEKQNYKDLTLLDLTSKQREEAAFWEKTIKEWQNFISDHYKLKTEKTKEFIEEFNKIHPDKPISDRNLRRKWLLYTQYGVVALAGDRRQGNNKGTTIPDRVYSVFMQWWLDENKPTVAHMRRLVEEWTKLNAPELLPLPSLQAFYTATKQLPLPVLKYFRDGQKVFEDECLPFIRRIYENINSNDIWSPDYHTLDFFVKDDVTGEVFRPHLIAWIDIRSRKIMSFYLTKSANSDGATISFRKAVEKYHIPQCIYTDHGREFLVSDFGGRGNRKKDENANYGTTILERLGVEMHNAIVKNAKAKVIERIFRNVTFEISKLIKTYCGGKPEQRPHRLNKVLKNEENIPLLSEAKAMIAAYFDGWYNEKESLAEGLNGKSPNECYYENLISTRRATKEELNLMLLRSTRLQKVKRNGVSIKIGDTDVWFYSDELVAYYMGQKVFVRYNPEDLKQVHVYDEKEQFITFAELTNQGGYSFNDEADIEVIKETNRRKGKVKEAVNEFMNNLLDVEEAPPAISILLEVAKRNQEQAKHESNPKLIDLVRFNQNYDSSTANSETGDNISLSKAVNNMKHEVAAGGEEVQIDMKKMIANARARKGEINGI